MKIRDLYKKSFISKNSVYKSWIVSYFLLMLVFFIIFNSLVLLSRPVIKKEIFESNDRAFRLISSNLENMKNEFDELSVQIMLDVNVTDMLKETELDNKYYFKINTLTNDMQKLMTSLKYAKKLILYKHNTDVLFIDGGLFEAERHFSPYIIKDHIEPEAGFEDWKKFICEKHNQELLVTNDGEVIYIHSIYEQNENIGTIMIVLNKDAISKMFQALQKNADANIIILNSHDEPVFSLKEDGIGFLKENNDIELTKGYQSVKTNDGDVAVFVSEPKSKIRCLYTVSSKVFYSSLKRLSLVSSILTVVFIIIGFLLSIYYSKKNYKPVGDILELLKKSEVKKHEQYDEFAFINESLNKLIKEGEESKSIRIKYNKSLFDSEITKILTNNLYLETIDEIFEFYNMSFSYSIYISAIVLVDMIDDNIKTEMELFEALFGELFRDALGKDYNVLMISLNNNMCFCLIGTNISKTDKIKNDIRNSIDVVNAFLKQETDMQYYIYLSETFGKLDNLKKMYNQINTTYMFNRLVDKNIMFYDEINYEEKDYNENLFGERIMNAMQEGELETVKSLIVQIIVHNEAVESSLQLAYLKYSILNILSKSIQYISDYNNDLNLLIDKVNRSNSIIEFIDPLLEVLENVCVSKSKSGEKRTELVNRVIEYVNQNYSDSNMNVDKIGIVFSLSPSYLSNLFKLSRGEMLKDYIVKVRLQNAKKMLLSGETVEVVAQKTGFGSSNSFIRSFKRYFGVTPNQFKRDKLDS